MGFAASQARFLSLTSRLSDNEYEAQQISQERLALNNQMDIYADEYAEATSNEYIYANVYDLEGNKSTVTLSYDVITGQLGNGGLGMTLVTASGKIVVSSEEEMQEKIEASLTSDGEYGYTEADFYIFEEVTDTSTLQKNIEEGNFYLSSGKDEESGEWEMKTIAQLSNVSTTYDTTDDAAAKAIYDSRMRKAESKDSMLEMRLDQIETSHKALETEMESLESVIEKNIENGFQTFG